MSETFYFYDLETSGRDPRWHRIIQFAGVRTDAMLEPVEEPVSWLVALDDDVVPDPEAALVTGLAPQDCAGGMDEGELFRRIASEFGRPRTCVTGFNSLRFDDEFVRYGFWRNLHDPYAREWQGGNSRWDLIDLARLMAALRPDGLQWPEVDGRRSFRLELLAKANGIEQLQAHDARSDVLATLGLARAIRAAQPRLFDHYLSLRDKRSVADLVLPALARPFVHVSSRYSGARSHLALAAAVAPHPVNRNSVIVADLGVDPADWAELPAEALRERLFARAGDAGDAGDTDGTPRPPRPPRPPLKELHLNKVPAVAPLAVVRAADAARLELDPAMAETRLAALRDVPGLATRVRAVYAPRERAQPDDVDGALYHGFLPDADRNALIALRDADESALRAPPPLDDPRARELLFRFRARRHPGTLEPGEQAAWAAVVRERLRDGRPGMAGIADSRARIASLLEAGRDPELLARLGAHLDALAARWGIDA